MSKIVMSLPKGMVKSSGLGGVVALTVYALLQMVSALLIDREVVGVEYLYPMVCVTAAVASFVGCVCCVLWGKNSSVLSVSAVVIVFLTLTLAAALLTADTIAVDNGLTGVGLSMAAGGLLAAMVVPGAVKRGRGDRRKRTARRRRS